MEQAVVLLSRDVKYRIEGDYGIEAGSLKID